MEDKLPIAMEELQSQEMRMPERSEHTINSEMGIEKEFCTVTKSMNSEELESSDTKSAAMPEDYATEILDASLELSSVVRHFTKDVRSLLRCRLCAALDNDMIDIFGSDATGIDIMEIIDHCLPVVVKQADTLPKQICLFCLEDLKRCYRFHETVLKAEKQLLAFSQLESIELEDTERNYQTPQLCKTQLGLMTQYYDVNGSFETFSDGEIGDEQLTTVSEVARTEDNPTMHSLSSLRACSVLISPIEFDCNNNPVVKSGRKSRSDFEFVTLDSITEACDSQEKTELKVIHRSTCDSGGTRNTHSGSSLDGAETSASRSRKTVNHRVDLVNHEKVHTLNQPYGCTMCARVYANKKNLMSHYKLHINNGLYGCQHCEEKFTCKADRDCHHSSHMKERPYKCIICGMAFCQRSKLKQHATVHSNARNHTCSVCDKSFKTSKARNRHMVVHTADQPWKCDYCQKRYKTEESLQRHLVEHDKLDIGARLFVCEYCDKKFTNRTDRERHHHIHTTERPYECTICKMVFSHPSTLKEHTATRHVGVKNYACSMCDKSFKTSKARKRHMTVHTDEKPWECDYCKKYFKRKYSLRPHFTRCKQRPSIRKL